MSRRTIEINFRAALSKADELDGIANELERALKRGYTDSMTQLAGNWAGDNAAFYQKKGARLAEQIQSSVSRIRTAASEVRRAARVIHAAEMLALKAVESSSRF